MWKYSIESFVSFQKDVLKKNVSKLKKTPHLIIIQANDDEGSKLYIGGKLRDAAEIGIKATHIKLPFEITQEELLSLIEKYNLDPKVHGIIVQLPLYKHLNEKSITLAVNPNKDVDGFHPLSKFISCTPGGIVRFLEANKYKFAGKNAVIVGRSIIVGRPMANLLINRSANVTILHSKTKTKDFNRFLKSADLIVLATGHKWLLDTQKVKKSAIVMDVGISRTEDGVYGDAHPNLAVRYQSPVPGGVGLLTRLTLMNNVVEACKYAI